MKRMTALLCMIALSTTAFAADTGVVVAVSNVTTLGSGREAVVEQKRSGGASAWQAT